MCRYYVEGGMGTPPFPILAQLVEHLTVDVCIFYTFD